MVVVGTPGTLTEESFEMRRFGTTSSELRHLVTWLQQCGVRDVVMESTAQYWKPVWLNLEPHFRLFLAQAWSNRAPQVPTQNVRPQCLLRPTSSSARR